MVEGRFDLILLGWTAFIGFSLISDFFWSSGATNAPRSEGSGSGDRPLAAPSLGLASSELFRGRYTIQVNGTLFEEGMLRMTMAEQATAVPSAQFKSLSATLHPDGHGHTFSSLDSGDMFFNGIEMLDAGKVVATGGTDSTRFWRFGSRPCRLSAALAFGEGAPGSDHDGAKEWKAALTGGNLGHRKPASRIGGEVASLDCGFTMAFEAEAVDVQLLTQKVVHYSFWANVLTILQIRCYLAQMRHTEDGPSAGKVSLFCIMAQALMDAYDSFLHLCLGLASQYMFNTVAMVSLFKFVLFSLLEARYMLTVWRQRRSDIFNQGWEAVRRELSWLYTRFYGVLVVGLVLIYKNLDRLDIIVVAFQLYWVPQILHDSWQGSRNALCPTFYAGISITRSLFVLYLWGCPSGIFSGDLYPRLPGAPSNRLCATVVGLQALQVSVMMLQQSWGPRWFVPWVCMPWAYNYRKASSIDAGTDCVICMAEIDPEDARRLVTPCAHHFHQACLEQWMDVKMECPTCRTTLPPIQ